MACDASGLSTAHYACKCLNVRIITSQTPSGPPEYPRDEKYTPVFVKNDGISVTHPEVTVRVASKPEPIAGSSKQSRFLAVTCLFCNLAVYRVHQTISPDVVGNESTLLPTEEWVEREILKTATGWIDVHKDSLNGETIHKTQSSPSYVPYFSLVLPPTQSPPPTNEEQPTSPSGETPSADPTPTYLSDLPPLFLPPPFTPSHPIFVHLAEIAGEQSQQLRSASEQRILDFVKTEIAGIEMKEMELKSQVEALWKTFRQNLNTVQRERSPLSNLARAKDGDKLSTNGTPSSARLSSSVLIRNFVPEHVSPLAVPGSLPRVSALSASLATSSFHHPREAQRDSISANQPGSSPDSVSSSRTGSSTLVLPTSRTAGVSIQEYRRNINDDINTQASYRYFINLEEDMNRYKRAQEETKQKEVSKDSQRPETSKSQSNSSPDQETQSKRSHKEESRSLPRNDAPKAEAETTPSRGRDKGKRKVTFDVEPAVVTTQSDGESTDKGTSDSREMLFPLEDLEGTEHADSSKEQPATLPLFEQSISRPLRPRTSRPNPGMEAFASLRPASLPNPSHIRPMRSQPGVDSSSQSMLMSRAAASIRNEPTSSRTTSTSSTPRSDYDAAILKLVAADTPSHRGAWTPESKAWQAFIRGKESKENLPPKTSANILEEDGDGGAAPQKAEGDASGSQTATKPRAVQFATKMKVREYDADEEEEEDEGDYLKHRGIPGSMPIQIALPVKKEPLTLASYAIRAPIADQLASALSPPRGSAGKPMSSAAIHKAAYAERDRIRARDPGAMDFVVQEDDEDEEEAEGAGQTDETEAPEGDKARKHALRILQLRSELPEEGMWRSLA